MAGLFHARWERMFTPSPRRRKGRISLASLATLREDLVSYSSETDHYDKVPFAGATNQILTPFRLRLIVRLRTLFQDTLDEKDRSLWSRLSKQLIFQSPITSRDRRKRSPGLFSSPCPACPFSRIPQGTAERLPLDSRWLVRRTTARGNIEFKSVSYESPTLFEDPGCKLNVHPMSP